VASHPRCPARTQTWAYTKRLTVVDRSCPSALAPSGPHVARAQASGFLLPKPIIFRHGQQLDWSDLDLVVRHRPPMFAAATRDCYSLGYPASAAPLSARQQRHAVSAERKAMDIRYRWDTMTGASMWLCGSAAPEEAGCGSI
jgi:hypothetical protein